MTGEDLGLKPSTLEQAKFEYSPLAKIFNKGLKEEEKKEELLKRLKNIEKSLSNNTNDKSTLSNARSESSSARSESSKKTSVSDDVSNNLVPKNETKSFFECLKTTILCFF